MGKRAKGLDAVQQKNMLKKSMLASCKKYAEQLEKENYALKNDPNTVIGQFIGQFRELYAQNQRLSTLSAALIKKLDDKVVLSKEEMESYNGKRINIKWEIPDGETIETAKEFTFTYELEAAPEGGQPVQQTETPGQPQECNDPNCELAGQKHLHINAAPTAKEAHECSDPNCSVDAPHVHADVPVVAEEANPGESGGEVPAAATE